MTPSSVLDRTVTVIGLEFDCLNGDCREMAARLHETLVESVRCDGVSVLPMPVSAAEWRAAHRTARKRADRARRLGYQFAEIDRSGHNHDRHEINVSASVRQGRPMSPGYLEPVAHGPLPAYPCDRHRVHTYGVLDATGVQRAYLDVYRCGDLVLWSMILGHAGHLANDIMYLLAEGLVDAQAARGGFNVYHRHDGGTDGLRFYKERVGFSPTDVDWGLA